jgi:hypothetical protein
MLWMGKWSPHHAVTTTTSHEGPDLESPTRWQMIQSCGGWGSHSTWSGSHFHFKHIKGDWQPSYAVDGEMEPPSCCYHHTCNTRFGKSDEIIELPSCSGCDSHPTWDGSHIHSKHVKGDWHPSYAVDGDMELPSCFYHHTCGTRFGTSAEIIDDFWETNDIIMHCLRL